MKYLWNKRRLAALAVVAAVGALTSFVVLPAMASNPGDLVPPAAEPSGVTPTDVPVGGNGNCSNLFGFATGSTSGIYEYDNSNPKTATGLPSDNPDGVTFDITVSTGNKDIKDKYFSFVAHGAAVVGVGVNGGTDSTVYTYGDGTATGGSVTADGYVGSLSDNGLHAPAQSPSQLYSISHLTFCYRIDGFPCSSTSAVGTSDFQMQFASCTDKTEPFFFESGNYNGPYVGVSSANTAAPVPSVGVVTFDNPIEPGGVPTYTTLEYTDTYPFDLDHLKPLRYCQVDPREGGTGTALGTDPVNYTQQSTSGSVLPTGNDADGNAPTSCLISLTTSVTGPFDSATGNSPGTSVAYVYSDIDNAFQMH